MGRPKGSKNKPKVPELVIKDSGLTATLPGWPVKPKRTRKALGDSPLEKLAKVGLTLEDLKALLGQAVAPEETSKADQKAALLKSMRAPLSPAETAKLLKEAQAENAKVRDPQITVDEAVEQVIKPNWASAQSGTDGLKHFLVNASRNGYSVSFDKERWDLALKTHGIRGKLEACKPEAGIGEDLQSVSRWRVMIG